jgi:hypothetical protein
VWLLLLVSIELLAIEQLVVVKRKKKDSSTTWFICVLGRHVLYLVAQTPQPLKLELLPRSCLHEAQKKIKKDKKKEGSAGRSNDGRSRSNQVM